MSSQANKDQFLKQFEQIVEGIKQNRVKVCSPVVRPQTHNHVGLPVFLLFASLLTASLLSFILSAENEFFFCALYWGDQNTQWLKVWCFHDPCRVPWKRWKVWFGRIVCDRDRWLFDVKTVKMVHWSVKRELSSSRWVQAIVLSWVIDLCCLN